MPFGSITFSVTCLLVKVMTISKFASLIPCTLWDALCLITGENVKVIKVIMKVLYSKKTACRFYNLR